jgi:hypothetical protein
MIRFLRHTLLFGLTGLLLTGCFETTEELTINENGSGTYSMAMDFSQLFQMFDAMGASDSSAQSALPKNRQDTTVNFRSFTDTAKALTTEQKALFRDAQLHLVMDEKEKEFKMNINMPYKKPGDVTKLMQLLSSENGGSVLGNMMKGNKALGEQAPSDGKNSLPDINSSFDITVGSSSVTRKLNKQKHDSVMQQYAGQFGDESMGSEMLAAIKLNTVIHLPRAVKKVTATKPTVSADKKTITIKGTLVDLFKNPQVFSYSIDY